MSVDMSAAWIVDVKSSLFMSEWKSIACNFSIWDRGQTEQTHYKTNIRMCLRVHVSVCWPFTTKPLYLQFPTLSWDRDERKEKMRILMFVWVC